MRHTRRISRDHPGEGALTALAFVLIIGEAERFNCGKQIAAYLGLVPKEDSTGEPQRLGHISRATRCCVFCWRRRRKQPCAMIGNGASGLSTWQNDEAKAILLLVRNGAPPSAAITALKKRLTPPTL